MRRSGALVVAIASLLFAAVPGRVTADSIDDAEVASLRCDFETALRLYGKLAGDGHPFAQFRLGELYYLGRGTRRDYAAAMTWFLKAAGQGVAEAQFKLGIMHLLSQGVPQDYTEAARWFRRAADRGNADAQSNLGLMYLMGEGVPYDYVLSHLWYSLAASGYPDAQKREIAAMNRDRVEAVMTAEQVAEAERLARDWRPAGER